PDGFLVVSPEEIASLGFGEAYPAAEVEAALELVRGLDPPGVACRDLRESLLRQLDARPPGPGADLARRVVTDHWDVFLRRQFAAIAKSLGVELQALEPTV